MRALITRPLEDTAEVARALERRGIVPVIEPMLNVRPTGTRIDVGAMQAVLLTSRNGARALAAATDERAVPVYAVGDATAALAREAGFRRVESAGGDAAALARLAIARLDPADGPLFHVAGTVAAGELADILTQNGFAMNRKVLYEAAPVDRLSDGLSEMLSRQQIDMALFYSPRTAETFVGLLSHAGLKDAAATIICVCLSPAVADAAAALDWRDIAVATRPDGDAMLAAVDAARRKLPEEPASGENA